MNESDKSETTPERIKSVSLVLVLIVLLGFSFILSIAYWERSASKIDYGHEIKYQILDGTQIVSKKDMISLNNYYPFLKRNASFQIFKTADDLLDSPVKIEEFEYASQNISIKQAIWASKTLEGENRSLIYSTPDNSIDYRTTGMASNIITVEWSYNLTYNQRLQKTRYSLDYVVGTDNVLGIADKLLPDVKSADNQILFFGTLFFFLSTLSGFILTWLLFIKTGYRKAYTEIKNFKIEKDDFESVCSLSKNLKLLKYFTSRQRSIWRFLFGLSFLIFKVHMTNCCKHNMDECAFKGKEKVAEQFKKNSEMSENKVLDLLPEKQTVIVLVSLLAALGISLSFNLAAVSALILSAGLFYVFFNIGSLFYFFGKTRDIVWPAGMFALGFFAAIFSIIIPMLTRALL